VTLLRPIAGEPDGRQLGRDARRYQPIAGADELSNTTAFWYEKIWRPGRVQPLPRHGVRRPDRHSPSAIRSTSRAIARLAYQPLTHQLYLAPSTWG